MTIIKKKPIILIPGIQGTKLASTNNVDHVNVWTGLKKYYTNLHNLKLQEDGMHDIGAENIIEKADVENLAYSEIVNYLRSLEYNVYIFGYDWRKSNEISAQKLFEFVKNLSDKINNSKINFLTHSMGGLVLSCLLKYLSPADREKYIDKVIFTVPPFLGSIEATFNLVIGRSKLFNSSDDFRKVGATFPGLYELLPVYKDAYEFEDKRDFDFYSFSDYWQQETSKTDEHKEKLEKKHKTVKNRLKKLKKVRTDNNYVFDLNKLDEEIKKRIIVLAGGGEKTQTKIRIKENERVKNRLYKYYFDFEMFNDEEKDAGDGTVPLESSTAFMNCIKTYVLNTNWIDKRIDSHLFMADWHSFFLNNGRVQNIIKRYFNPYFKSNDNWYQSAGDEVIKL